MPDMKMAFSTNAFVRHTLAQAVRTIGNIGYQGVEILYEYLRPFFQGVVHAPLGHHSG